MPENSWPENDSSNELDPLDALLTDWVDETDQAALTPQPILDGRRIKAAMVLSAVWAVVIGLHLMAHGIWLIWALTTVMTVHGVRLVTTRPKSGLELPLETKPELAETIQLPSVSLVVAAKNEAAVIARLVKSLCGVDYPADLLDVWIVDDNSSDETGAILQQLKADYQQLNVLRRGLGATGGKSGALNQVLPLTQGEIIGVFDADAVIDPGLVKTVITRFQAPRVGAVQVRKAISNSDINFWTQGQTAEMALDAYFQQQRIAVGGLGELRGNGQFVRRAALADCGGWNESTITDDLDLSLQLHLQAWDIDLLMDPAVSEEGVTTAKALWHQRNRWAEGGYQSYLDYWSELVRNRLGTRKSLDMLFWLMIKYGIPTATIPDLLMAALRAKSPLLIPLTSLSLTLSVIGMLRAIPRTQALPMHLVSLVFSAIRATVYMLHWLPVVAGVTLRMSVRAKRLKWVKTAHEGSAASGA
ncbi:glycosyltransferase family 2 protein [Thermosynechococcaceae cyanobacterium BACA0444]|uniref:Beta-monoglucosyldiacylglycerol synthase n=1 Tax=Pseudocalidococcus azoricus BACA0444 TaxID=2918990 RepID=A0AAE4JWQ2_9CYAN|nr:glycosyltransferase family 2 protein [Pseudocalidococcus azoricus]MDS3860398.1 glycosyltransferase family 2 protein [Pseudocalidococcus azoricus BACA0444]